MPTDKDLENFGAALADQLLPVIKEDIAQQIEVRLQTAQHVNTDKIAVIASVVKELTDGAAKDAEVIASALTEVSEFKDSTAETFKANLERIEQVEAQLKTIEELEKRIDLDVRQTETAKDFALEIEKQLTARIEEFKEEHDSHVKATVEVVEHLTEEIKNEASRKIFAVAEVEKLHAENAGLKDALAAIQLEIVALKAKAAEPVDHAPMVNTLLEQRIAQMQAEITLTLIGKVDRAIEKMPIPQNGKDGTSGRDGKFIDPVIYVKDSHYPYQSMVRHAGGMFYALRDTSTAPGESADWQCVSDGVASVEMNSTNDQRKHVLAVRRASGAIDEFTIDTPVPLYQGVFSSEKSYSHGDIVTYDGSTWFAVKTPNGKPKETDAWVLQTKRGADAKSPTVRSNVRGEFTNNETYEKGDLVDFAGRLWIAKKQNRTMPPADVNQSNANWSLLS